jgi:hypothetical protein
MTTAGRGLSAISDAGATMPGERLRAGDSQEEIQKIDDRAPTILQATNAAGLETGGARSPGGCREPALPAKSRAISTRSGAASAYGHTPGTLDLANGLPLLGEDSDK